MNLFKSVKELNLPLGKYAVFGSGPLAAHGIRETRDIDILVTPEIYQQVKLLPGWVEKGWPNSGNYLQKENFEITSDWNFPNYEPDIYKLISKAEIMHDIPFVKLEEVLAWKKAYGRDKDLLDIQLILNYLSKLKS